MNWILGIALFLTCVFLINHLLNKRKQKRQNRKIKEEWGKPKSDVYLNMHAISGYFRNKREHSNAYQIMEDDVCNDLDLDAIFKQIDRTSSKIGQQYLYYKLRVIQPQERVKRFAALSGIFDEDTPTRTAFQRELLKLNDVKAYSLEELTHFNPIEKPRALIFLYVLSGLAIVSLGLSFIYPASSLLLLPIFAINMVFHYRNKETIMYYMRGLAIFSKAVPIAQFLANNDKIQPFYTDFHFLRPLANMRDKIKFLTTESKLYNEFLAIFWIVSECIKILFNIEYIVFYRLSDRISKERENMDRLFEFIGEIDVAISCASVRSGNKVTCTPIFTSESTVLYEGLTHPLINDCVTNDLELINNSMLITGSNMSGKTTFIRSVALNALLAQTIHICFAKSYKAPFFKIYSVIRIADDLLDQKSYYLEEVLRVKNLVEASKDSSPCLFIMDELLKGTNTLERVSAGVSIISFLNKPQHFVMVATHDMELTKLLPPEDFKLYHFTESIENNKLLFDHKLKKGPLKTRNAIKILEINGYPKEIIEHSKATECALLSTNGFQ